MLLKTFKRGGIHPAEEKLTAGVPIIDAPLSPQLRIMLSQCIGAPSIPVVKQGEEVGCGQLIAEAGGFVGAPIHSPVNGTVSKIEPTRTPQGIWQQSIVIDVDLQNPFGHPAKPRSKEEVNALSAKEIIEIIGNSGIVGLGGATFPTRVKLSVPEDKKVDYVIINGAECEPYLTCDDALMRSASSEIVKGILLIMRAVGAENAVIGIEENKPEAISALKNATVAYTSINIVALKKKYPQGSEKQLIAATVGRIVPAGGLPLAAGCIVDNVATAYAIYDAVFNHRPLTSRIVTVTGRDLSKRGNYRVVNGVPISVLLDFAGGIPENTGKIIAGGPMMGRAISQTEATATKGLSGLVVLPESESRRKPSGPCIRCARCVSVCPMGLEPYLLMLQGESALWETMKETGALNCLECGSCSYICPASRPILDYIRLGRQEIRKIK